MAFDFARDPFENLLDQIDLAGVSGVKEPIAMSLATATKDGLPDVRAVLFKGLVRGGLSFYTNYDSQKSQELSENPNASALFFWAPLAQQIRVIGKVDRLTREESEAYFASRPRLSQIGAWASLQSQEIPSFDFLNDRVKVFEEKFANQIVPCPSNWGGFRILPLRIEFWFGREGRLHERFVYERKDFSVNWTRKFVSP